MNETIILSRESESERQPEAEKPHIEFVNTLLDAIPDAGDDGRDEAWFYACCRLYEQSRKKDPNFPENGVTVVLRKQAHRLSVTTAAIPLAREAIFANELSVDAAVKYLQQEIVKPILAAYEDSDGSIAWSQRLSQVEPEDVRWLWKDRIPLGKVTLWDGDPGQGKSTMSLDIAAKVSTGCKMPDGSAGCQGSALLLSAEDGVADTIVPRLIAAGANLDRIHVMTEVDEIGDDNETITRPAEIPKDLSKMRDIIKVENIRLVVIDPLMAFLADRVNTDNDKSVRRAIHLLANLAEETGVAILVIRHLNKTTGTKAIYRGGGSIGYIGAARAAFMVFPDPDDDQSDGGTGERYLFACTKINLSKKPSTLAYRIVGSGFTSRIQWEGESHYTADELVIVETDDKSARYSVENYFREALKDNPRPSAELMEELKEVLHVSERTIKTAKKRAQVESHKSKETGNGWWMCLPGQWEPFRERVKEGQAELPPQGVAQGV